MYPTKMEANGRIYNINTDFRVALMCFKAINDPNITNLERFYAIETLLLGTDVLPQDEGILQAKMAKFLRCGLEENASDDEVDMDYIQDEVYVKTSIRQCYQIDLNSISYMHWWEYNELISGLTTECLLNRIRDIRSMKIDDIKDPIERAKLLKMKERVKLKKTKKQKTFTEEEKHNINNFLSSIK